MHILFFFSDIMSPWPRGQQRDLSLKPILKYFTQDASKEFWICKVTIEDGDGNENICEAKMKGMGSDSNLGNNLEVKRSDVHSKFA